MGRIGQPARGVYGGRPSYSTQPPLVRGVTGSSGDGKESQPRIETHVSRDSTFCVPAVPPPSSTSSAGQPRLSVGGGGSRIARPSLGSGIPRPGGSRLPGPTARTSGIPKPGSRPGSRASSVGPRRGGEQYY